MENRRAIPKPEETLRDFGSERLPTGATENPWDVSHDPGVLPPSSQVAGDGEGESESLPEGSAGAND